MHELVAANNIPHFKMYIQDMMCQANNISHFKMYIQDMMCQEHLCQAALKHLS